MTYGRKRADSPEKADSSAFSAQTSALLELTPFDSKRRNFRIEWLVRNAELYGGAVRTSNAATCRA